MAKDKTAMITVHANDDQEEEEEETHDRTHSYILCSSILLY